MFFDLISRESAKKVKSQMESNPSMNFSSYYFLFSFRFRFYIYHPLVARSSFPSPIAIVANASTQDLENVADNEASE